MKFYPFRFKPIYIEKIWGGSKLKETFSRDINANNIGESWEVSVHSNGKLAGKDFLDLKIIILIK